MVSTETQALVREALLQGIDEGIRTTRTGLLQGTIPKDVGVGITDGLLDARSAVARLPVNRRRRKATA